MLFDINLGPVTVSAALGALLGENSRPFQRPWSVGNKERLVDYDDIYDSVIFRKMNYGVRAEIADIAGFVSLAATYKYADSLLNKKTAASNDDVINELNKYQAFGFYSDFSVFTDFGITAGYSAQIQSWQNPDYEKTIVDPSAMHASDADKHYFSQWKEINFPFYHAIDLRINYSGIKNLCITSNNNVSFASIKGVNPEGKKKFAQSWVYVGELNENIPEVTDRMESYLGFYNALGITYNFKKELSVDLQAANQHGIFTMEWEKDTMQAITNYFGLYTGVTYTVYESDKINAGLRGGLALKFSSYSYMDPYNFNTHKAGITEIGIPLGLKVVF